MTGQAPNKARTLTGRTALSGSPLFVAPKAQGMVSWLVLPLPPRPDSHFFLTFFDGWKQHRSGEGDESRARVLGASLARSSERSADP